jgi:hypothetical protein
VQVLATATIKNEQGPEEVGKGGKEGKDIKLGLFLSFSSLSPDIPIPFDL